MGSERKGGSLQRASPAPSGSPDGFYPVFKWWHNLGTCFSTFMGQGAVLGCAVSDGCRLVAVLQKNCCL